MKGSDSPFIRQNHEHRYYCLYRLAFFGASLPISLELSWIFAEVCVLVDSASVTSTTFVSIDIVPDNSTVGVSTLRRWSCSPLREAPSPFSRMHALNLSCFRYFSLRPLLFYFYFGLLHLHSRRALQQLRQNRAKTSQQNLSTVRKFLLSERALPKQQSNITTKWSNSAMQANISIPSLPVDTIRLYMNIFSNISSSMSSVLFLIQHTSPIPLAECILWHILGAFCLSAAVSCVCYALLCRPLDWALQNILLNTKVI